MREQEKRNFQKTCTATSPALMTNSLNLDLRQIHVLLIKSRLPPLVMGHVPYRAIRIRISDLRLAETIQLLRVVGVQEDGKRERDQEAHERHAHSDVVAIVIGDQTGERRKQRAAAHGGDDPGGAALGVAAQAADGEGEDGGEDGGLEEEDEGQHGDAGVAVDAHGGGDEDHDHCHEQHQDPAGLHEHHGAGGCEAAEGEEALADRVAVRGCGFGDVGALDGVFDELGGNADLGADVAELRGDTEEELVLLVERLILIACQVGALFSLQSHIRVCDFGYGGEEEDDGEAENEGRDAEVCPLDFGQVIGIRTGEEDTGGEEGRHNAANGLERLGEFEAELR